MIISILANNILSLSVLQYYPPILT